MANISVHGEIERDHKISHEIEEDRGDREGPRLEAGISLICRNPNHLVGITDPADRRVPFYENQSFVIGHDLMDKFNASSASAPKSSKQIFTT